MQVKFDLQSLNITCLSLTCNPRAAPVHRVYKSDSCGEYRLALGNKDTSYLADLDILKSVHRSSAPWNEK